MQFKVIYILVSLLVLTSCAHKYKKPETVVIEEVVPIQPNPSSSHGTPSSIPSGIPHAKITKAPLQNDFVPGSIADFQLSVGDRVFFAYNRFSLTEDAKNILKRQSDWLNQYQNIKVLIAGNCDERGTREYNLALGARRAKSVRDYLVSQGVDSHRITTISYGKERPVDPNSSEQAWSVNRNAQTQLKNSKKYVG